MRIHRRRPKYKEGDYLMECDLTGRIDYRSKMRKLWNGLWAHKDYYEKRNPQDFLKVKQDRQAVQEARPRKEKTYTAVTADDL